VLLLVGMFGSSSALAGAYGIAVTGTMVVTAMLLFVVIWRVWKWGPLLPPPPCVLPLLLARRDLPRRPTSSRCIDGGWCAASDRRRRDRR
jgi:K+ transporter